MQIDLADRDCGVATFHDSDGVLIATKSFRAQELFEQTKALRVNDALLCSMERCLDHSTRRKAVRARTRFSSHGYWVTDLFAENGDCIGEVFVLGSNGQETLTNLSRDKRVLELADLSSLRAEEILVDRLCAIS